MDLPLGIDFSEKVVVITGAGGILCGTMAKAFARAGAKVAALDLNEEAVKQLAEECRAKGLVCKGYQANVLETQALQQVHDAILKDLGPCDILINGAGGNHPKATTDNEYHHEAVDGQKTFFDLDAAGVEFVFQLNFQGTLIPTQIFAKDMADKKKRVYFKYFFDERVYSAHKDTGVFRCKGGCFELYPVAGDAFCRNGYSLQCDRAGIFNIQSEPPAAVSGRRYADRAFQKDFKRYADGTVCGWRRAFGRRIFFVR